MASIRTRFAAAALLLCVLTLPGAALAAVTYTTFPSHARSGGLCLDSGQASAVGIQIPAGTGYTLNSAKIAIYGNVVAGMSLSMEVHDDNAGEPGSSMGTIASTTTTNGDEAYTFTATSPITLQGGKVYWIVTKSNEPSYCPFAWEFSRTDPAGSTFSLVGQRKTSGGPWENITSPYYLALEIDADPVAVDGGPVAQNATAVPAVSQWGLLLIVLGMLATAGFGLSRRGRA